MHRFELFTGDCRTAMLFMEDSSIDSVVCDPPYGISFMAKHWDYDVPTAELWADCLRVLKPGGHIVALAGSRTHDLMSMALRLAGFECRDTVMWEYSQEDAASALFESMTNDQKKAFSAAFPGEIGVLWQYASGFPKSRDPWKGALNGNDSRTAERALLGRRLVDGGSWLANRSFCRVCAKADDFAWRPAKTEDMGVRWLECRKANARRTAPFAVGKAKVHVCVRGA